MERLDGGSAVPERLRGGIVALGNFDGFHLGHQAVVARALTRARQQHVPALVATFDPHPLRFFKPDAPFFRLTTMEQRERLVREAGADELLVFTFDEAFAAVSSSEFVTDWLVRQLAVTGVVTGADFTFGKARGGDVEQLRLLGRTNHFSVDTLPPVRDVSDEIVSSSRIRTALQEGDCETATRLLTRPFTVEGVVEHGDKRGRTIGYPTANLGLGNYLRPRFGIYAVRGRLANGRLLEGAANLGIRPTFEPAKELLEAHFFDFRGDLYGQRIEVELVSFIRPEEKYDSVEALVAQMDRDCIEARRRLG